MNESPAQKRKSEKRILILESDETLLSSILSALRQVAPEAVMEVARDVDEANRIVADDSVALFVLDLDALEPDVVRDLRARHPQARAIVLASAKEKSEAVDDARLLEKPFADSDFVDLAQTLLGPGKEDGRRRRVLVIDDSLMMLKFVGEILTEANYEVVTAGTAQEGLQATRQKKPDLILLDYLLPDVRGDELSERLGADKLTADVPVVFMSGFGAALENVQGRSENVLGILNKPFTTNSLIKAVEDNLSKVPGEGAEPAVYSQFTSEVGPDSEQAPAIDPLWNEPEPVSSQADEQSSFGNPEFAPQSQPALLESGLGGNVYFSGETPFFSFGRALRVIGQENLTGVLRSAGARDNVDLYAREGKVVLVTSRDGEAYCAEAPVTLVNIDAERVREARETQSQNGCPLFITLVREELILREPALQLVQHYGQKLFAQQWSAERVRFAFEQTAELPHFTDDIPADDDIEHWMLTTLRFVQGQDVGEKANYDSESIPAYTRDGFERVQKLRLTVAEAQFASQFNGARSIAQIARNLRLDLRFARLTLFRFVELDIVECWPPAASEKAERSGLFKRLLGRSGE